ncbi:GGDEF domain-containing protein, partial [Vibrio parahaemolyticus]|nr:GGDEF domain-containing protein [Vibrio parahaemolyticus]
MLSKVTDAGIDPSSVSGEEAITLWEHIGLHIASTNREKAHCYIISAEYRREIKQLNDSISELKQALELLVLPEDVEDILSVKASLSERLVELGDYNAALTEYVASTNIAVEYGYIDEYVLAIIGMGNLCDAYGDHQRALRYYQKIDAIDHAIGSRSLRLRYKLYMLACYISLNRTADAKELLSECEELS